MFPVAPVTNTRMSKLSGFGITRRDHPEPGQTSDARKHLDSRRRQMLAGMLFW
jgi:hypothetical protein